MEGFQVTYRSRAFGPFCSSYEGVFFLVWKELGSVGFYLSLISREFSSVPWSARKAWKAGVCSTSDEA